MSNQPAPHFHNEQTAYKFVEARVRPHGVTCPKCDECKRVSKMHGNSTRIGAYKCYQSCVHGRGVNFCALWV